MIQEEHQIAKAAINGNKKALKWALPKDFLSHKHPRDWSGWGGHETASVRNCCHGQEEPHPDVGEKKTQVHHK